MYRKKPVSVVIPALNEEPSIAKVVIELAALSVCAECGAFDNESSVEDCQISSGAVTLTHCVFCQAQSMRSSLVDTIIVCDNGSSDNTAQISESYGAVVVEEQEKGYGAACLAALNYPLVNDLVVFVDGDYSVVGAEMPALLDPLFSGADLVIGSRTLGSCETGALTVPQAAGNRVASALMRLIWRQRVTDLGPFRAISRQTLNDLGMQDRKFGWTVEMQVRALQLKKNVVEVPVSTRKRIGQSKVSGTLNGVIGASKGILGTIAKLYWAELAASFKRPSESSAHIGQASKAKRQR